MATDPVREDVMPEQEILRLRSLVPEYLRQLKNLKELENEVDEDAIVRKSESVEQSVYTDDGDSISVNSDWLYPPKKTNNADSFIQLDNCQSEQSLGFEGESHRLPHDKVKVESDTEFTEEMVTDIHSFPSAQQVDKDDIIFGFNFIPDQVAKKLFAYFDYRLLQVCRLVCSSWNKQISSNRAFLESSIFHMNTNIDVIKIFENSSVDWLYIHFQGTTSENKTKSNYQQKFLQSKFQPYAITTNSLISLHLYKSEMGKDSLLRWLSLCKWLRYLEITDCVFITTVGRTGWKHDPSVVSLEHLRTLTMKDMILSRLVDTLKLLYNQIKGLEELKIYEKKRQPMQTKNIVTTMEGELINLLKRYLQKSRPKMKSFHLSIQKFDTESLIHDFFKKIPTFQIPFQEFGFEIISHKGGSSFTVNLGSEFNPIVTLKAIFKKSEKLKKLFLPGIISNLATPGDLSSFFPPSLQDLASQITLPDSNPESHLLIGLQKPEFSLKKIAILENAMTDYQWVNLKKSFPYLTELSIMCGTFGDHSLMTVSSCLINLQVLKLEKVKQITDFGLTGIDEEYLKSLKESWPFIPDTRCEDSVGMSNFPLIGKPISSMENLREFYCVGSADITDVGIAHGLFLSRLEVITVKGSTVKVTDTGLDVLASNSPYLASVNLTLSSGCVTDGGIRHFISKLPYFDRFKSAVELKTSPKSI